MIVEKLREYIKNPLIMAGLGFLLGLIIGFPILGWGLFPVQWTDAEPRHLRQDLRVDYMRMAIQSYGVNPDQKTALERFKSLGPDAMSILDSLSTDPSLATKDIAGFRGIVISSGGAASLPAGTGLPGQPNAEQLQATLSAGGPPITGSTPSPLEPTPTNAPTGLTTWLGLLGVFCLLTLIIGGALVYVLVIRKRKGTGSSGPGGYAYSHQVEEGYVEEGQTPPIAQFMTTYMLGDDLYDDSFSIDAPSGEFLGECGVGISDTIGVGEPKKVTAFEVWLFDKNDIQTVTKVLMSEHAYNDQNIRQRLLSKGEPVLIRPNERILLETATLQLEARLVDLGYGQGALPQNSFFERVTLELAVWPRH
jgi:hypothetical protein